MSVTGNPQQLLLVKQLYEDAYALVAREDDLSLTKAVILLDLSVEQMLNQILRDFHHDFSMGRKDIGWHLLWQQASPVMKTLGSPLLNHRELSSLHEVRNLAQHNASIPTQAEVKRYINPAREMISKVFSSAYQKNFDNFTVWDLIENEGLRHWLQDSELALDQKQLDISIAGCNVAHDLIVSAIRKSKLRRFRTSSLFSSHSYSRLPRDFPSQLVNRLNEIESDIEFLENEVVAIGVGMPLVDTRRFQKMGSDVLVFCADSGDIQIRTQGLVTNREELAQRARFMLNYLSRLIRLVYEVYPGVIETIQVKKRLREQQIWRRVE